MGYCVCVKLVILKEVLIWGRVEFGGEEGWGLDEWDFVFLWVFIWWFEGFCLLSIFVFWNRNVKNINGKFDVVGKNRFEFSYNIIINWLWWN